MKNLTRTSAARCSEENLVSGKCRGYLAYVPELAVPSWRYLGSLEFTLKTLIKSRHCPERGTASLSGKAGGCNLKNGSIEDHSMRSINISANPATERRPACK